MKTKLLRESVGGAPRIGDACHRFCPGVGDDVLLASPADGSLKQRFPPRVGRHKPCGAARWGRSTPPGPETKTLSSPALDQPTEPVSRTSVFLDCALLLVLIFFVYSRLLVSHLLWPEDAIAWYVNAVIDFRGVLHRYIDFNPNAWYRPTTFHAVLWPALKLIDPHRLVCLRVYSLSFLVLTAWAVYGLTLQWLPRQRMAGIVAALYFALHPSLYYLIFHWGAQDNVHILLTIGCIACYGTGLRTPGRRGWVWAALSAGLYALALTAKEATLTLPLYVLALHATWILFHEGVPAKPLGRWLRRIGAPAAGAAWRLLPFFLLMLAYYLLRVRHLPHQASAGYRTELQWDAFVDNMNNFVFWIARIFSQGTWFEAHNNLWNNGLGLALLAVTIGRGVILWRKHEQYRHLAVLAVAWIFIFLLIPMYCGGHGHHINLPLVGYAILVGAAVAGYGSPLGSGGLRQAALAVLVTGMVVLAVNNVREQETGYHVAEKKMNGSALFAPPVPRAAITPTACVFVEDRYGSGTWPYGAGHLFAYVYGLKDIEERVVPPMHQVPEDLLVDWANRPQAFFFSYGDDGLWHDNSKAFGELARAAKQRRSTAPSKTP